MNVQTDMTTLRRTHTAFALTLLLAALTFAAACTSDDQPTPTPSPSPTTEAMPTSIASTTPTAPIPVATLDLPDGCHLFDEGWTERPVHAGEPTLISLVAAPCGSRALEQLAATALHVQWIALGFDADPVAADLRPNPDNDRWEATVTFPEPGRWVADTRLGIGDWFEVFTAEPMLAAPSPSLPLPAAPKTIAVLDGAATEILRTFEGDFGDISLFRNPDRVLYIGTREGDTWLLAGNVATGEVQPLLRVGRFPAIVTAPDSSAVVVQTRRSTGRYRINVLTADGRLVEIDENSLNGFAVSWSPDAQTLILRGDSLWVLAADGAVRFRQPLDEGARPSPIWSPDSTYALFWTGGQLTRLDINSLVEEVVVSDFGVPVREFLPSPDFEDVALSWQDGDTLHVAVMSLKELPTAAADQAFITGRIVASFEQPERAASGFGGIIWSQDGRRLALVGPHVPEGTDAFPGGTAVWTIDLDSGEPRRVAEATDFYAAFRENPVWSADSSTLYALRFNCSGCEPSSSAVDIIDVDAGRILATFDPAGFLGLTADRNAALLTTPQGLLRTDGRTTEVLYDQFRGGLTFGPSAAVLDDPSGPPLIAVQLGVGQGVQLLAARPDGSDVSTLAVLPFGHPPAAILDASTVVLRGNGGWVRHHLLSGVEQPYLASGDALEKYDFTLSPSGHLAVDRDSEGFAILDATNPAAPPVLARRPYRGDLVGLPTWSPDERRLAFNDFNAIAVLDLDTGDEHIVDVDSLSTLASSDPREHLWTVTWTLAGDLIFATTSALWRLDIEPRTATKLAGAPDPGAFTQGTTLAYSPDGRTLVAATTFGVFALDAAELTSEDNPAWRQLTDLGISVAGGALHWSPDSTALAIAAESGGYNPEGILVVPLDGSGAYRLVAPGALTLLDWLPDGRIIWTTTTGGV